ncbi:MAG TPA: glycosyltransferase family 9 protein [Nitrospiraceae bacterium]|jgi:ADP-heptose:LPS heptosyltransferase|nr:glycosyltransferase family 9 protein [Nitrospiraceae bacterium]
MSAPVSRAVLLQLARLGDLVQSLPVIAALKAGGIGSLDLVCPAPFAPLASLFSQIDRVLPWDGLKWRTWADLWKRAPDAVVDEVNAYIRTLTDEPYPVAYNLNQHPRAVLAAYLLADRVIGPGEGGPLRKDMPPWAAYLRRVAQDRSGNRVHLADAFCGLCRVRATGRAPHVPAREVRVPTDLEAVGQDDGVWVAVVVGAGDRDRCVPPEVWTTWITALLDSEERAKVVLVGGRAERERGYVIQDGVAPLLQGRVWDAVGRTDVRELAGLLSRCHWVIGADTGPLHLGAATGAKAMGWYFARARVHETGPYGEGHWVWQAEVPLMTDDRPCPARAHDRRSSARWPVKESVELLLTGSCRSLVDGWSLWRSRLDRLGAYFTVANGPSIPDRSREAIWERLCGAPCVQ